MTNNAIIRKIDWDASHESGVALVELEEVEFWLVQGRVHKGEYKVLSIDRITLRGILEGTFGGHFVMLNIMHTNYRFLIHESNLLQSVAKGVDVPFSDYR